MGFVPANAVFLTRTTISRREWCFPGANGKLASHFRVFQRRTAIPRRTFKFSGGQRQGTPAN
jgi:hypothetical protein